MLIRRTSSLISEVTIVFDVRELLAADFMGFNLFLVRVGVGPSTLGVRGPFHPFRERAINLVDEYGDESGPNTAIFSCFGSEIHPIVQFIQAALGLPGAPIPIETREGLVVAFLTEAGCRFGFLVAQTEICV